MLEITTILGYIAVIGVMIFGYPTVTAPLSFLTEKFL